MKHPRSRTSVIFLLGLIAAVACQTAPEESSRSFEYPAARASAQVDEYHGVAVADPYRWLEDPDSPETRSWIEAENELTFGYLEEIEERGAIQERLTELWNYERYQVPTQRDGKLFYLKNDGLQNQSVLYVLDRRERVLLDPNTLTTDGTIALASWNPSPDGRLLAYGLSDGGSDWRTWHVRDVESGADLSDEITRNKFGGLAWAADSSGFFYSRYERPLEGTELRARNTPAEICFHRLGTSEAEDLVVIDRPAEGYTLGFSLTENRDALVVSTREVQSRNNELRYVPLARGTRGIEASTNFADSVALVEGFDSQYRYIGDDGQTLWVLTNENAPNWHIKGVTPKAPGDLRWKGIVREERLAIQRASSVGGKLVVSYLHNATSRVRLFEPDGLLYDEVEFDGLGTAAGFGGDAGDPQTYYAFTSYTRPTTIYRYDLENKRSEVFQTPELGFDPADYETQQIFYPSMDGTLVPMFLTYKQGMKRNRKNPVYLYGYGGFNISLTPSFSVSNLVWMEMGGIVAVPNLRGGGEFGEAWHEAGTKLQKQNVFDDFIAAADWLIKNAYTNRDKLAIAGGSNGGLLVGACMTQRPDLYAAALPAVGVMDMLRYHEFTIGWAWAGDYGTSADAAEFEALYAYSPLHNLEPGTAYPATLVTTADHDDRVVPAHSFKFAAALQAAQAGTEPTLIRIETRAGHGAGKPTSKRIEEAADKLAFLVHELGLGD